MLPPGGSSPKSGFCTHLPAAGPPRACPWAVPVNPVGDICHFSPNYCKLPFIKLLGKTMPPGGRPRARSPPKARHSNLWAHLRASFPPVLLAPIGLTPGLGSPSLSPLLLLAQLHAAGGCPRPLLSTGEPFQVPVCAPRVTVSQQSDANATTPEASVRDSSSTWPQPPAAAEVRRWGV